MNFGMIIPMYGDIGKLCYTYTDSFIICIKTEDFFEDISNDVEGRFDASNYVEDYKRPIPIGKNKKVPGLFKGELGGKIITKVVALRPKAYAYLDDDDNDHKKSKGTKNSCFKISKIACLIIKQERFKRNNHDMYTEEVNKIALIDISTCQH